MLKDIVPGAHVRSPPPPPLRLGWGAICIRRFCLLACKLPAPFCVSSCHHRTQNLQAPDPFGCKNECQPAMQVDTGQVERVGPPRMYTAISPSPDAQWLLVSWMERPFSFNVPCGRFPLRVQLWTRWGWHFQMQYTLAHALLEPQQSSLVQGVSLTFLILLTCEPNECMPPGDYGKAYTSGSACQVAHDFLKTTNRLLSLSQMAGSGIRLPQHTPDANFLKVHLSSCSTLCASL